MIRGVPSPQPTAEQAREVVAFLRGARDFPEGSIDWLATGRLGAGLGDAEQPLLPGSAPQVALRAKVALEARHAILSSDRPLYAGQPVSFETLGAVYYILTAGQYRRECPNRLSPQGLHRWRFAPRDDGAGRIRVCDYCGEAA